MYEYLSKNKRLNDECIDYFAENCYIKDKPIWWISSLRVSIIAKNFLNGEYTSKDKFYKQLTGIKKPDLSWSDFFIFSIHGNDHWAILALYINRKRGYYYDSFRSGSNRVVSALIGALLRYEVITRDFLFYSCPFTPTQEENWECGYISLLIVRLLVHSKSKNGTRFPILRKIMEKNSALFEVKNILILREKMLSILKESESNVYI
jgi:hypothetical protein